ncbi:MAG: flavodoxin family protein [Bacteroidota bacterium]
MKTLIAYYSFTQNNEKLAKHLQRQLNCDIVKIETKNKRNGFSILLDLVFKRKPEIKPVSYYLHDYDHVIFLAPIWAGKIAMPMKSFLNKEKANINQYSFVTLCGGNPGQKEKILDELTATLQKRPVKLLELWVSDLLPAEKRGANQHSSRFRIEADGFAGFESQISNFIKEENMVNSI